QLEAARQAAAAAREARPFDGSATFPDIFGDVPATFAHATVGDDDRGGVIELDEPDDGVTPAQARRARPGAEQQLELVEMGRSDDADEQTDDSQPQATSRKRRGGKVTLRATVTDPDYELPPPALLTKGAGVNKARPADVDKV